MATMRMQVETASHVISPVLLARLLPQPAFPATTGSPSGTEWASPAPAPRNTTRLQRPPSALPATTAAEPATRQHSPTASPVMRLPPGHIMWTNANVWPSFMMTAVMSNAWLVRFNVPPARKGATNA